MSDRRVPRSLYWRIALGLFASLALIVAAEGGLFLWITQQAAGAMPAQNPRRLAAIVASDLSTTLEADPALDVERYVREQYARVYQPFVVLLRDGRTVSNHDDVPADLLDAARELPWRDGGGGRGRRGGSGEDGRDDTARGDRPDDTAETEPRPPGGRRGGNGPGGRGGLGRLGGFAPILVSGAVVGRVAVLPGPPPFVRIARELGPAIAIGGLIVLIGGGLLIALLVVAPVRTRIRQVQTAAERLRSGDLGARAPATGTDEVAALARSFNDMADELARRTRALESSDAARRHLLADVSHELMTPLTAMRGYLETLSMPEVTLDEPTRQRYLHVVEEETRRLERLIGDLLDLARLEGGGGALERERGPVAALTNRVAARHERALGARGIRLDVAIDPDATTVFADASRLEQVLQNLAANAIRHTPDGGTVAMRVRRDPRGVALEVRDSGPGIPDEHLPLIFDRFYKADASRQASGGSGLGLSIVKAIVEAHGGTVTAHNDHGAVFTVTLPDADPAPVGESPATPGPLSPAGDGSQP